MTTVFNFSDMVNAEAQRALEADLTVLLAKTVEMPAFEVILDGAKPAVEALLNEAKQGKFSDFGDNAYDLPKSMLLNKLQALPVKVEAAAYRNDVMMKCRAGMYDD